MSAAGAGVSSPAGGRWPTGEIVMPVIVVTRLRLKDPALLDEFFTAAVAAIEQAQKSTGNLGADALADANNAWWSVRHTRVPRRQSGRQLAEVHTGGPR
jgi:hypothetical protein